MTSGNRADVNNEENRKKGGRHENEEALTPAIRLPLCRRPIYCYHLQRAWKKKIMA